MALSYNRIAGQNAERLAALSDGIFAVAMTLMVLDLRLPTAAAIHGEHDLWRALWALLPRLLTYLMCVINTRWSIAFILLVQVNYAVAPRFRRAPTA
jgi:uncharacterized membrane protein